MFELGVFLEKNGALETALVTFQATIAQLESKQGAATVALAKHTLEAQAQVLEKLRRPGEAKQMSVLASLLSHQEKRG